MFEDKWKKGSLSEPVKTKVTQLVTGKMFYIIALCMYVGCPKALCLISQHKYMCGYSLIECGGMRNTCTCIQ